VEKKILFIAPYPSDDTIKDGYIQRIMSIDNLVNNIQREYMYIRFNPFGKTDKRVVAGVNIYRVNRFNVAKIKKLINKYKYIYLHSIYMYKGVSKYIKKHQTTILDFHGIIPEELTYSKKYLLSAYYSYVEKKAAKNINYIIFVTEAMANYFRKKYPNSKAILQVFPIIAKNSLVERKTNANTIEVKIKEPVVFIYSGNSQKWQNIPEMLSFIKKNDKENYIYIFLSGKKDYFESIINSEFVKIKNRFIVDSVLPEELHKYYSMAHYGFLIRDNHILNKVACPTKMMEYLFYGIIPIVKLKEIGDFFDYDLVDILDNEIDFEPRKSKKNMQLANNILEKYINSDPFNNIF
jgi:hypothetical protein